MKKFLWLLILGLLNVAYAETITQAEQKTLQSLDCRAAGFKFSANQLLFDEVHDTNKHLFLLKNISLQPVYIDFPAGHTGASAGLAQTIDPHAWLGYVSVRGKDKMPIENKKGQRIYKHPVWACATIEGANQNCEKLLTVCEVHNTQEKTIKNILQKSTQANWAVQAETSIQKLLQHWFG